MFTVGIIGSGKVAQALLEALAGKEQLRFIVSIDEKERIALQNKHPLLKIYSSIQLIPKISDIIIIAVSDSAIKSVSQEIADKFKNELKDKIVFHTSGFHSMNLLSACKKNEAKIAACHPYQTFYYPHRNILNGIGWGIEADKELKPDLKAFFSSINGKAIFLDNNNQAQKVLYHISAVAASNFTSGLLASAYSFAQEAGINAADFIPAIVETTVKNNIKAMHEHAPMPLTGPIARGDIEALKLHIQALDKLPELKKNYIYHSILTAEKAFEHGVIDKAKKEAILKLMENELKDSK